MCGEQCSHIFREGLCTRPRPLCGPEVRNWDSKMKRDYLFAFKKIPHFHVLKEALESVIHEKKPQV